MKRIRIPVVRDCAMLMLGSGGMIHELFIVHAPDPLRVSVSLVLLGGPAALNSWWLARNPSPPSIGSTEDSPP